MTSRLTRFAAVALTAASLLTAGLAHAAGDEYPLDNFPEEKLNNLPALQNGAKLFVNYCMGCHSLEYMRYNRLADIGLTDEQIKDNLLFTGEKVGDMMTIAMRKSDAAEWLGAAPPDLSLTARARASGAGSGADWIYTFLRSFYRDGDRATGWNNSLFPNVGMPNVLWSLQGQRGVEILAPAHAAEPGAEGAAESQPMLTRTVYDASGVATSEQVAAAENQVLHAARYSFTEAVGGSQNTLEFDESVGDLVAFLTYVSDPTAKTRTRLGIWVLLFIAIFFVAAWMLNKVYWKDVR